MDILTIKDLWLEQFPDYKDYTSTYAWMYGVSIKTPWAKKGILAMLEIEQAIQDCKPPKEVTDLWIQGLAKYLDTLRSNFVNS
jgi:hypothetical protein